MHGKPRHIWERRTLDTTSSVLESKRIHENRRRFVPEIHIKRGVRQCCVLSPRLFNMYTENTSEAINTKKGIHIGGATINNLLYADNTVLLAETEENLQEMLNELNRIGKTFDINMNAKTTKTMLVPNM